MALIGQIAIAMVAKTDKLAAGLNKSAAMIRGFGGAAIHATGAMQALAAIASVGVIGAGLIKSVKAASDVAEAMNKVKQEFGDYSGIVIAEADRQSRAFGVSKVASLDAASAYAAMFRGAGYNTKASAELSAQFTRLTTDTESYYNLATGEAQQKIQAGLAGEIEPLRRIGVLIDDNKVKAQAYAMGLAKTGEEISQEAKVQARIPLILAGLAKAQGDRARTATDVANAWREVQGRVLSVAETIGAALEPITKSLLGQMGTAIAALGIAWDNTAKAAVASALTTVNSSQGQANAVGLVQASIMSLADAWNFVSGAFQRFLSYVASGLATLIDSNLQMFRSIDTLLQLLGQAPTGIGSFGTDMVKDLERQSKAYDEAGKAALEAFNKGTASQVVAENFAKARQQIEAVRAEIGKIPAVSPAVASGLPKKEEKHKEVKFASAMTRGSSEAASTILRSKFGGGKTSDELKKTAQNTSKANEHLSKIAAAVTAGGLSGLTLMESI